MNAENSGNLINFVENSKRGESPLKVAQNIISKVRRIRLIPEIPI